MTYVFLFFIPGAAGNFLSRCLNLMEGACCWTDNGQIPKTLEEKIQLLNYKPIMGRSDETFNWIHEWENRVQSYHRYGLPPTNSNLIIWPTHPRYNILTKNIAGIDDQQFSLYIDPTDAFEWVTLNALYKNSYIAVDWLKEGAKMQQDPDIFKISLANMIRNEESFLLEVVRICNHIGCELTKKERSVIIDLYREWKTTTLDPAQFSEFKQKIGWQL